MEWPRSLRAFSTDRKRTRASMEGWRGRRLSMDDVGSPLEAQAVADGAEARFQAQQEQLQALEEAMAEVEREKEERGRMLEMEREKAKEWMESAEALRDAEEKVRDELLREKKMFRKELEELQARLRKETGKAETTEKKRFELQREKEDLRDKAAEAEKMWAQRCNTLEQRVEEQQSTVLGKEEELQKVKRELKTVLETSRISGEKERETFSDSQEDVESLRKELNDALASAAEERKKSAMLKEELDQLAASRNQEGNSLMIKNLLHEVESLTKEVTPLRRMRDRMENNALLQEKLQAAVERADRAERVLESYNDLEEELRHANQALCDWRSFAEEYPQIKCAQDLNALLVSHEREMATLQSELDENKENVASLSANVRNLEQEKKTIELNIEKLRRDYNDAIASSLRSERKALLLAEERDSLQSILNSYQEEATVQLDTEPGGHAPVNQALVAQRVSEAERSLREKESLLQTYESEIANLKARLLELRERSEHLEGENTELKSSTTKLESENEGLYKEMDKMVQRLGRGEFNTETTKVVHMTRNPELEAHFTLLKENLASVQSENTALKAQLVNIGKGNEAEGVHVGKYVNTEQPGQGTAEAALLEAERTVLQHRIAELEKREMRYKEAFKDRISAFREACYLLFGYRIDMGARSAEKGSDKGPVNTFCIRSMYAERDADELKFEQETDGSLVLIPTPYSDTLQREIDTFVTRFGSLPALLANLTMESFNRHTSTA
mmetsp:Transcript_6608/g.23292  ORF Transcript_6608/g.23292 Transcript_6608/m.23292 type:complete len:737 (+) Transcript_6608:1-2211(+)